MRFVLAWAVGASLVGQAWGEEFVGDSFSFDVPADWRIVSRGPARVNLRHRLFVGGSYLQVAYMGDQKPAEVVKFFLDFYRGRGMARKATQEQGVVQGRPYRRVDLGNALLLVLASPKQGSYSARFTLDPADASRRKCGYEATWALLQKLKMQR